MGWDSAITSLLEIIKVHPNRLVDGACGEPTTAYIYLETRIVEVIDELEAMA